MRLSYSALETYQICPLKFKFREIDKIKTPQTKEAFFGSLIHEILKILHEPSQLAIPTEEEILKIFSEKWDPSFYEDPQEETIAFAQGVKMLKNYYAGNYPARFNIVSLETRFEAPVLDKGEAHIITGIIDRIDKNENGIFEVIDYKTSKKMPAQKFVDNNLQLAVYHLGVANRWPSLVEQNRPVKLSLYYLPHNEKLSTIKNAENINETKEKILGIIDKIKISSAEQSFEPNPGPLCGWCQYQPHCPLFKHKFMEKALGDEEARELAKEYFELKSRADQDSKRMTEIREKISAYMNEQKLDRVFSESGSITRSPKKNYTYDGRALKAILEPLGKWKEILAIDSTKLKKVIASLSEKEKRKIEQIKKLDKETKIISVKRKKEIDN
jgi:putative RecB family exonuclease